MTPLAASPTCRALLAAICAEPSENTPRLALADWLDEQRDEDDADRAEFIRLQVAIARPPWNSKDLIRSERLLEKYEADWRRGERCGRCHENWTTAYGHVDQNGIAHKGDCPDCHGIGWTGPLAVTIYTAARAMGGRDTTWRYPATFERGFIAEVHAPLADVFGPDGQPTAWAVRLVRAEPVQRIVLSDQMPRLGNGRWWIQSGCNAAFSAIEEYWKDHPEQAQPETPAFEGRESAVFYQSRSVANLARAESERLRKLELAAAR